MAGLTLLYKHMPSDSPLSISVYAPALAALALDTGQSELMNLARAQYGKACQRTNQALGDARESLTDDTLASILHLGLFEAVAFDSRSSPTIWTAHIYGALELLKRRGLRQLDTVIGRDLYVTTVENIRVSCAQQQIKVPKDLIKLDSEASKLLDQTRPGYRLRLILDDLAEVRCKRRAENVSPNEIIDDCLRLEDMVLSFCQNKLGAQLCKTVPPERASSDAFDGREHRYPNLAVAKTWNTMRMIRLFLCYWIMVAVDAKSEALAGPSPEEEQLSHRARGTIEEMAADILASVPQFIHPCVNTAARFLILPLIAVGEGPLPLAPVSDEARLYARDSLRFLGTTGRMPQALRAAEMLEEGGLLEDWYVVNL
jgi:hypothetical protein